MMEFKSFDPRFNALILPPAQLDKLWTGGRWTEGPVWFGDSRTLLFSDIPNNRMLQWAEGLGVREFRGEGTCNYANGNTRDREGRLITCEHGTRRVTRTETDGRITVLAERYRGKRLNSPNDVVVAADGAIWFTDPSYGILNDYEGHAAQSEIGACNVYRLDLADASLEVVADDFVRPNGLAFSADRRTLYVGDSSVTHDPDGNHHVRAFDVVDGARLANGRVFAQIAPGFPDGMRCDVQGNLWCSSAEGLQVFAPDGTHLGAVLVPEHVSNLCFGGPKRNRLFITATTSLYALYVAVNGA
ncbi:MAG: SMP-30/gluconolactonase/LRE family protein [Burkholderiales bacterium]|nr:SMP-30/gluconolactonase/LRE family protein [Burkholderiales bacterium]